MSMLLSVDPLPLTVLVVPLAAVTAAGSLHLYGRYR